MPLKYNPLLKDGLQYDNTAAIQAEIDAMQETLNALQTSLNALQNQKITKCFTSADFAALETNEIFEWQGETTTIDGTQFVNGFFYKKIVGQQTLPSGTKYFLYEENYPTITKNGYVFTPGNYYHLDTITPANGSNFYNYALYQWNGISRYYFLLTTGVNLQVGDLVWDNQDYNFVTVVSLDDNGKPTLSNGEYISEGGKTGGSFVEIIDCKNSDGTAFSFIKSNMGRIVVHYTLNDNVFTLIDWFFVYVVTRTTTTPQTIGVDSYTQTNTQPGSSYTLPTAAANVLGGVKVGSGLSIDANGVLSSSGGGNVPMASPSVLGGVKVGDFTYWDDSDSEKQCASLSIDDNGVLSLAKPNILYKEDIHNNFQLENDNLLLLRNMLCGTLAFEITQQIAANTALFQLECWPESGENLKVCGDGAHILGFRCNANNSVYTNDLLSFGMYEDNFIYSVSDLPIGHYLAIVCTNVYLATWD